MVRGAFGAVFKKLSCAPECIDAKSCERRSECAYARVFEPKAAHDGGPSGLADWPRPFVFRACNLDGRNVHAGDVFHFDVNLFDAKQSPLPWFVQALAEMARCGLRPGRVTAELIGVDALGPEGETETRVFDGFALGEPPPPLSIDLNSRVIGASGVRVKFLSPTELKSSERVVGAIDFHVLLARIRDRISTLRALYGEGPLDIDFRAFRERAANVRIRRSALKLVETERRSARTGLTHSIGGLIGEADYEGDVAEFVPYLRAGEVTGVGRHTVWGKGLIVATTF